MAAATVAADDGHTPSNTVYVRNLEERIKISELIEALTEIFSEYGTIIDLVAKKNLKAKGQAFIVFDSTDAAERAIDEVQGFELFEKPMVLDFAKTKSDATIKMNGSEEDLETHKRHRMAEKERRQAQEAQEAQKLKRPAGAVPEPAQAGPQKKAKGAGLKSTGGAAGVVLDEFLPPNKILFVQSIPDEYDVDLLSAVFARFEGFKEVRMVPGRKGLAFVEYEAEQGAITAKENTAGITLGSEAQAIKVTYQRQ